MPVEVVMPKWGLTMEEGLIGQWLKSEGDEVTKGEPLLEVETEKMANVVESPASGILTQIIHPAGSTIAITDVIAVIGAPGENVSQYQAPPQAMATESATSEETTAPEKTSSPRIRISPLV